MGPVEPYAFGERVWGWDGQEFRRGARHGWRGALWRLGLLLALLAGGLRAMSGRRSPPRR